MNAVEKKEKPTWRHWVNKEGKPMTGKHYHFNTFKIYWSFRQYEAEEIRKFDFEQSFTGKFLKGGFNPDRPVSPTINWFGVSKYDPNLIMTKGNKKVVMSLQGMAMPSPTCYDIPDKEKLDAAWALIDQREGKYIGMFKDGNVVYQTWTGELPSKEICENFIND